MLHLAPMQVWKMYLLFCLGVFLSAPVQAEHLEATVVKATGAVKRLPIWKGSIRVKEGEGVRAGEVLETNETGRLLLQLTPAIEVQMNPNARLDIERIEREDFLGGKNVQHADLGLGKGTIIAKVNRPGERAVLKLSTSHGTFTAYQVVARISATVFTVFEGTGWVRTPDGATFRLQKGEFLRVQIEEGKTTAQRGVLSVQDFDHVVGKGD